MQDYFEIRLDFKPNTGGPERIFFAMAEYLSAFENLIEIVGKGIDPQGSFSCELSGVQISSLKSIVKCIGNYCSALSRVPIVIAGQMIDLHEINREEQIEKIVSKIESEVVSTTEIDFPNQVNINRFEFSKGLERLTEASKRIVDGETIDVRNNEHNVIFLNTRTFFSKGSEEIFEEASHVKRHEEILLIKRPTFVGNSMWDFKSVQRKKSFSAAIEHEDWLKKYQNRQVHLEPGDAISAIVEYVAYKERGDKFFNYKDHKVVSVQREIKKEELQLILDIENKNESD